ncbi:hypothetical protein QMK17_13585 [Rhodococcus sp. G-MC3]|uniref:hypothetical protein n=1 Tax=Rhodococcus sp. G-MC3 TaxID=3046209 RepID=UPI0024B923FE|nr:hypothetical protein [Rhodococcus sp. G-MC3]MDJ0394360.1 hypothetical protein [Rhodococcus sp. G-MC3]
MTSPAASLRGGAVGAMTVALAVAAHGAAGGGHPPGSAFVFLLIVGIGVGVMTTLPNPRSGWTQFCAVAVALVLGQSAAHVALAVGDSHQMMHGHSMLPSPTMLGFHAAASAVAAVLICVAERLYGPITSVLRAVLDPPLPLPDAPPRLLAFNEIRVVSIQFSTPSISRRGPPVSV